MARMLMMVVVTRPASITLTGIRASADFCPMLTASKDAVDMSTARLADAGCTLAGAALQAAFEHEPDAERDFIMIDIFLFRL